MLEKGRYLIVPRRLLRVLKHIKDLLPICLYLMIYSGITLQKICSPESELRINASAENDRAIVQCSMQCALAM
jgi:hypothetical protein